MLAIRDRWRKKNNKSFVDTHKFVSPAISKVKKQRRSLLQRCKDTITDLAACPDPHVGWIPDAVRMGIHLIKEEKINIILATGSPWSCMVAGVLLRKETGIPLILDFRDPWVANPGFVQRGMVASAIERKMERYVVSRADAIVTNTKELRENFLQRFAVLKDENVHVIPNGFEEFLSAPPPDNQRFTIVHAGGLYFSRSPEPLLVALHNLIEEEKIPKNRLRVVLVGGLILQMKK